MARKKSTKAHCKTVGIEATATAAVTNVGHLNTICGIIRFGWNIYSGSFGRRSFCFPSNRSIINLWPQIGKVSGNKVHIRVFWVYISFFNFGIELHLKNMRLFGCSCKTNYYLSLFDINNLYFIYKKAFDLRKYEFNFEILDYFKSLKLMFFIIETTITRLNNI